MFLDQPMFQEKKATDVRERSMQKLFRLIYVHLITTWCMTFKLDGRILKEKNMIDSKFEYFKIILKQK